MSIPERLTARFCPEKMNRIDKESRLKERSFVDLASHCQTVICCRVTPKQKAIVVEMMKKHKKVTTLAIGDGGNDVNMIKTAHIGVGISGQEGLQAVIASDFALAQFRFLQRLLLVHGRWSYFRMSKFLGYYFYKTFALLLGNIWFAFFSCFSGQTAFDMWYLIFNGVVYTVFPALVMGMIDQDVGAKTSLRFPVLYCIGQRDSLFNYRIFVVYVLYGIYSSMATFFIPMWAFWDTAGPDGICDYQVLSMTISTGAFLAATAEVCLAYSQWNVFSVLTVLFSIGVFFLTAFLTQLQSSDLMLFSFKDVSRNAFSKLFFWAIVLLSLTVSVLPSLVGRCVMRIFARHPITRRTKELRGVVAEENGTVEMQSYSKENWLRKASNAFSHDEGYADLITQGASIRRKHAVRPKPLPEEERAPCQEEDTTCNSGGSL